MLTKLAVSYFKAAFYSEQQLSQYIANRYLCSHSAL